MATRLTESLVKGLEAPSKGNQITYDADVKGLGVRITAAGARSFILNYRVGGRERRYTIGSFPDWSVAAARQEAKGLKKEIDRGRDPMAERHADRAAPTVNDLCARYAEEHMPKKRPRSQREDEKLIERFIRPRLGNMKVEAVRFRDIDTLHRAHRDTPYQANRVVALLSKMFSLAIRWEWRTDNPARGVERFQEQQRRRYLSQNELARLTEALNQHKDQTVANVVRFLILTGARKSEALAATWAQFDLGAGHWVKPSGHTKSKIEHRVPLSAPALQLLTELEESAKGSYVFPGGHPKKRLGSLDNQWRTIREAAGLPDIRIHDLRHTYASILASAGLSLPIIGQLLGHTQPATTARYSHLFDDPLREATERVGAVFAAAGKKGADVVSIDSRKGSA